MGGDDLLVVVSGQRRQSGLLVNAMCSPTFGHRRQLPSPDFRVAAGAGGGPRKARDDKAVGGLHSSNHDGLMATTYVVAGRHPSASQYVQCMSWSTASRYEWKDGAV